MTVTTVNHTLIDPLKGAVQRAGVVTLGGLVQSGWMPLEGMTSDGQIITSIDANSDVNGDWSLDLVPNSQVVNFANTIYRYLPSGGQPVYFTVPDVGPVDLLTVLAALPNQPVTVQPVTGPAGTVAVDSTNTIAPGSPADVTNIGDASNALLVFDLPGSPTVDVDSTDTGAPGTQASVVNTGTQYSAKLKFTIPAGKRGVLWKGVWSSGTAYDDYDLVKRNKDVYICIDPVGPSATAPENDATHWALFAEGGIDGLGSVATVNGVSPDGAGNVVLTPVDIGARPDNWVPSWSDVVGKPDVVESPVSAVDGRLAAFDGDESKLKDAGIAMIALDRAAYDAINPKDPDTLYIVKDN